MRLVPYLLWLLVLPHASRLDPASLDTPDGRRNERASFGLKSLHLINRVGILSVGLADRSLLLSCLDLGLGFAQFRRIDLGLAATESKLSGIVIDHSFLRALEASLAVLMFELMVVEMNVRESPVLLLSDVVRHLVGLHCRAEWRLGHCFLHTLRNRLNWLILETLLGL